MGILTLLKFLSFTAIFAVRRGSGSHCFYKYFLLLVLLYELYMEIFDDNAEGPRSFSFSNSTPDRAVFFLALFCVFGAFLFFPDLALFFRLYNSISHLLADFFC